MAVAKPNCSAASSARPGASSATAISGTTSYDSTTQKATFTPSAFVSFAPGGADFTPLMINVRFGDGDVESGHLGSPPSCASM